MDGMQAAVILAELEIFDDQVAARDRVGRRYSSLFAGNGWVTPAIPPGQTSVHARYTLQPDNRDAVRKALQGAGIPGAICYPITPDRQPALAERSRISGNLAVARRLQDRVVGPPMNPYLDDVTHDQVATVDRDAL